MRTDKYKPPDYAFISCKKSLVRMKFISRIRAKSAWRCRQRHLDGNSWKLCKLLHASGA